MLISLKKAKESSLRDIAGSCPNQPQFLTRLNDATRQLMRRGDAVGTVQPIYVCISRGCVAWPRYVGAVRRMNWCGHHHVPINGLWWEFLEQDPFEDHSHWMFPLIDRHRPCGMNLQGHTAVQTDVRGPNRLIRAYCEAQADLGKTVTIFGLDDNQQPLYTTNFDGSRSPGVVITLASPFGSTSTYVSRIERVLKDETTGRVRLFAYDAVNAVLEDVATYEPSETNPDYIRYHLNAGCCSARGECPTPRAVVALVKLRFIAAKLDTDLVLIQNLDALKCQMQAIKYREDSNLELAREAEKDAIRELNLEINDEMPPDQTPVSMEPFHGACYTNQCW